MKQNIWKKLSVMIMRDTQSHVCQDSIITYMSNPKAALIQICDPIYHLMWQNKTRFQIFVLNICTLVIKRNKESWEVHWPLHTKKAIETSSPRVNFLHKTLNFSSEHFLHHFIPRQLLLGENQMFILMELRPGRPFEWSGQIEQDSKILYHVSNKSLNCR